MERVPFDQLRYDESVGLTLYNGEPFTGIRVSIDFGVLMGEAEFKDGVRSGLVRGWHHDGSLAVEGTFRHDAIHGTYREWHKNGQLALEQVGDCGVILSEKRWDEQGQLIHEYVIQEGGPNWRVLQQLRAAYGEEQPE